MKRIFVSAIGTDSGKTVFSAILTAALDADYWKPIQAGRPTDTDTLRALLPKGGTTVLHPEACLLELAASPHQAASAQNIRIDLSMFERVPKPSQNRYLVIEGAGGLMVPLNDQLYVLDLIKHLDAPLILVCNLYLGSINHSLLSLEMLRQNNIKLLGVVFNGVDNLASRQAIMRCTDVPVLLHIQPHQTINKTTIMEYANQLSANISLLKDRF